MQPMVATLSRVARSLDSLAEWTGRAVSWLVLGMVALTFMVVVLRYAFGLGWIATQEAVIFMHALVFMLGAAYTLKHDGHVRVDIFFRAISPQARAWIEIAGTLLLLLPVCGFLLWVSFEYVQSAWSLHEGSREPGGLPGVYLLKTAIPLTALLLMLQGLAQMLHALLRLLGAESEPAPVAALEREL